MFFSIEAIKLSDRRKDAIERSVLTQNGLRYQHTHAPEFYTSGKEEIVSASSGKGGFTLLIHLVSKGREKWVRFQVLVSCYFNTALPPEVRHF